MKLVAPVSLPFAAHACGGRLVRPSNTCASFVSIDTRHLEKGAIFFALTGEHASGCQYAAMAERRGAVAMVVDEPHLEDALMQSSLPLIVVDDTLRALGRFAKAMISRCAGVTYVGVTGSCGKSTTKEAISAILSVHGSTVKTPGNLNSEIGLPLSLLKVAPGTRYGVFEMGVDHVGEMKRMVDILKPDVAVLTNIGISHLEKFKSQKVIAHEKGAIFHPGLDAGFISSGCPFKREIEKERGMILGTYAIADLSAQDLGLEGWRLSLGGYKCDVHVLGRHLLSDVAAAVRVARHLGVSDWEIAEGLDSFSPMEGRATVLDGDVTIIKDCYNATLDSTSSMLETISRLSWKGSKIVVLGTMKELGAKSRYAHRTVARKIMESSLDGAFLYGSEMRDAYDLLKREGYQGELCFTEDFGELSEVVTRKVHGGDLCLVKGSRSMAMERIIPVLRQVG